MRPPAALYRGMDHAVIEETQLAERYVAGTVSDEEKSRFEEHFPDCPGCLDRLEAADGLRSSLKDLAAAHLLALAGPADSAGTSRRVRRLAFLAAAAALAAGISASLLYFQARRTSVDLTLARGAAAKAQADLERERSTSRRPAPPAEAAPSGPVAASVFVLNRTRSSPSEGPENRIEVLRSASWITLVFDRPERFRADSYRVRLSNERTRAVLGEAATDRSTSGMLSVSLPAPLLTNGDYLLNVEGLASGRAETLATYRFRAVATR